MFNQTIHLVSLDWQEATERHYIDEMIIAIIQCPRSGAPGRILSKSIQISYLIQIFRPRFD